MSDALVCGSVVVERPCQLTQRTRLSRLSPVKTVNIHEAKTHLSKLVEKASKGESFIIARAGKPMVKVVPIDAPTARKMRRFGFLAAEFAAGRFSIPDDFDRIGEEEIVRMFEGEE
jgi:prevent-host-death family protein